MARGLPKLVKYVLEVDRNLPEAEQTIFHIHPKTLKEQNETTKHYIKSVKRSGEDIRDMDVDAANKADIASFKICVKKVENYSFPDYYYEEHPTIKELAKEVKTVDGETFLYVPEIDSDALLTDVCLTLDPDSLKEISEASNKLSKLKEGEKK